MTSARLNDNGIGALFRRRHSAARRIRPDLLLRRARIWGNIPHPRNRRLRLRQFGGQFQDFSVFRFLKTLLAKPAKSRSAHAQERLDGCAETFRQAAERCAAPHAQIFWQLAGATSDLRNHVAGDPAQITPLRKLIFFFIPKMAELCSRWAGLAAANPLQAPDPRALDDFQAYLALIRKAEQACLSRQYSDLEASMETVLQQLERTSP